MSWELSNLVELLLKEWRFIVLESIIRLYRNETLDNSIISKEVGTLHLHFLKLRIAVLG